MIEQVIFHYCIIEKPGGGSMAFAHSAGFGVTFSFPVLDKTNRDIYLTLPISNLDTGRSEIS
jgi:hypothetical protein